jgi:uncharacterized protein YbjT (DUF2867 family)
MTNRVLVTGATGRVGREVVTQLVQAGVPVRALTRQPETAELPPAVEVVGGDLCIPDSLDAAFAEVAAVFLVWTVPQTTAAAVIERIALARSRVVYLSAPHQTQHPFFQQPNPMAAMHREIEGLIAAAGIPSTIIRPGMFASGALHWWAETIRRLEIVRWPYGAAETAPIDERDIATAAARTLSDDQHVGGDYVLTGPESLTQAEQVRIIGEAIGREVRFQEISADDFRRETASTWPRPVVDMLLSAWHATIGHPAYVTSLVADITGSPARSFREWANDHANAFRGE